MRFISLHTDASSMRIDECANAWQQGLFISREAKQFATVSISSRRCCQPSLIGSLIEIAAGSAAKERSSMKRLLGFSCHRRPNPGSSGHFFMQRRQWAEIHVVVVLTGRFHGTWDKNGCDDAPPFTCSCSHTPRQTS